MDKIVYRKRRWLNTPAHQTTAFIRGELMTCSDPLEADTDPGFDYGIDGSLTISDCGRQITLDIDGSTHQRRNNSIRKLTTVRDVCDEMIAYLKQHPKAGK